jgi:hypothetical protein
MPTLTRRSPGAEALVRAVDGHKVTRSLHTAYSRERIEEVIRAVAEDALIPSRVDVVPWHDETRFENELREAVREIADAANGLLAERLKTLLETAPSGLTDRLASAQRFSDLS